MKVLLERIRRINKLLQNTGDDPISFSEIACTTMETIHANTYVVNCEGKLLGYGLDADTSCEVMVEMYKVGNMLPQDYAASLLEIQEASVNVNRGDRCTFFHENICPFGIKYATVVPIFGNGDRLGTVVLTKLTPFDDDDLILAEYIATIFGTEIIRTECQKREKTARERAAVAIAIDTLSFSELEAVGNIFQELPTGEGLLVASKIADKVGITRSVIVNALRKLESAGVIEVRSLGMKGTHIKVMNDYLLEELRKVN